MFTKSGADHIESLIREAQAAGQHSATVRGEWEIDRTVLLPSDFTLILDGCHLRQADGCACNIFANAASATPEGVPAEWDHDISLLGQNDAVLDGGTYNGLSEKNAGQDGRPPIWRNNLLLFAGVDRFTVSGIRFINQRWWALVFVYCANGLLQDLNFCASDLRYDDSGTLVHGLAGGTYAQIFVKNADGIDLRRGCHHITIRNITGFTEDDTVALTLLDWKIEAAFDRFGGERDLHDIRIENLRAQSPCSLLRLLNQSSGRMYNITAAGVEDTSAGSPHFDRGDYALRVGDAHARYGDGNGSITDVTVCGIRSRARYAVHVSGRTERINITDVVCFDGGQEQEENQ